MDKIGLRTVEAIEEMARKNGTRASEEYQKLAVTPTVYHFWKYGKYSPSAYYLRTMALAGYDVLYILTGVK